MSASVQVLLANRLREECGIIMEGRTLGATSSTIAMSETRPFKFESFDQNGGNVIDSAECRDPRNKIGMMEPASKAGSW